MSAPRSGPVLVTGGAGFIGSNLADRLASEGNDVIVLDSLARAGVEDNLAWLRQRHPERITSMVADVRDADAVATAAEGARAVFHLAAQVAVTTSLVDPRQDFETNLTGTLNLLEALRRRGAAVPLVFASTNKVYGDLADIPLETVDDAYLPRDRDLRARGVAEDRPLDFHTPYGCSKGAADQYVLDYARSFGLPACVMRMSCIYGPRQLGTEDQGWVAHFLIRALRGEPISIYGDGRQVRDILHVADAVDAYLAAWRRMDAVRGRAFNLGGGPANAVSLRQLVAHIEQLLGQPVATVFGDWRAGDQRYFVSDAAALRRALGLGAPCDWRTGVAELARWLRSSAPRRRLPRNVQAAPAGRGGRAAASARAPLRLMMTADAVGGVWTYALDLACALRPLGVETRLAVLGPAPTAAAAAEARAIPGLELIPTGLPLDWLADDPAAIAEAGAALAGLARASRADVVQLNSPALAAETRFPAPIVGVCHSCLATWWAAVRGGEMPEDFRWRATAHHRGLLACDALVAPSAALAEATGRAYALPPPLVVHNGRAAPPAADGRREPQVFTAGRLWDEGKNLAALDAAAALIDAPVYAAGPLEGPNGARAALRHAQPLGSLDAAGVRAWLGRTPVFASAARYEPFGLAVLEAAQAGCALVLADIPSFRELWDGAAVFVPPNDPPAMAASLQALLDAPGDAAALGAAARARRRLHPRGDGARHARRLPRGARRRARAPQRRGRGVRIVYFTHSLASCWNHGNAHFLRGVLRGLIARGHAVTAYEPADAWSLGNLLADHGEAGLAPYRAAYPDLRSTRFGADFDPAEACADADLVIVHEWNAPALVAAVGRARRRGGQFVLLFHDTHHRAVSDSAAIDAFDLSAYDGVLAFGEALAGVYRRWGWGDRVFVWHEAADTALFRPPAGPRLRDGLVWIGNWGDGERSGELETFLMAPARAAGLPLDVYGVRYPEDARAMLRRYGARYRGWLPNARAPEIFARHLATVHVPRRYYAAQLPGIPTIRVFEALACGIPLVSAPWEDAEGLFRPGEDYLLARNGCEMTRHLRRLRDDPALRAALAASGLARIRTRHTCTHRVDELLAIAVRLGAPAPLEVAS